MMSSRDAFELYRYLSDLQVDIWLDGGWGVDALVGRDTRQHEDVDIVIQKKDVPAMRLALKTKGYKDIMRDDTSEWNFVMGDNGGHLVDIHVVEFDEHGNGVYGPKERGVMYPKDAFRGDGKIDGQPVKCLTAKYQIESHSGYKLNVNDLHDLGLLRALVPEAI